MVFKAFELFEHTVIFLFNFQHPVSRNTFPLDGLDLQDEEAPECQEEVLDNENTVPKVVHFDCDPPHQETRKDRITRKSGMYPYMMNQLS